MVSGAVPLTPLWLLPGDGHPIAHSPAYAPPHSAETARRPRASMCLQGTADAVRQYLWLFENTTRTGVEDFLILSGAAWTVLVAGRRPLGPRGCDAGSL